jgi:hypothetical protein
VLVVMSVLVVVVADCSAADDLGIRQVALPLRLTDVADEVGRGAWRRRGRSRALEQTRSAVTAGAGSCLFISAGRAPKRH